MCVLTGKPKPSLNGSSAQRIFVLIGDNDAGIHVSAFSGQESAQKALRDVLTEYSQCSAGGIVPRFSAEQIEACVIAGHTDGVDMPNADAYRIELVNVMP